MMQAMTALGSEGRASIVGEKRSKSRGLATDLKERTGAAHFTGAWNPRAVLVMAQVAFSVIALLGAGLFVRSLRNAMHFEPGWNSIPGQETDILELGVCAGGTCRPLLGCRAKRADVHRNFWRRAGGRRSRNYGRSGRSLSARNVSPSQLQATHAGRAVSRSGFLPSPPGRADVSNFVEPRGGTDPHATFALCDLETIEQGDFGKVHDECEDRCRCECSRHDEYW